MISTNIDGSAGSATQLFDLLSLVANPDAASKRLTELQTATEEYKRYIEAVAPVSEIAALREQAQADRERAAADLVKAKIAADDLRATAITEAAATKAAAVAAAKKVVEAAEADFAAAAAKLKFAEAQLQDVAAQKQQLSKIEQKLNARAAEVDTLRTQAQAEKQEYVALKAELHAKHQAFLSGL